METLREILRLTTDGKFEKIKMSELIIGDYFKMHEPNGDVVKNEYGEYLFKVNSKPIEIEEGIFQVSID